MEQIRIGEDAVLERHKLPIELLDDFEGLWALHPVAFHDIKIHGRTVKTPRWQQAYGRDYRYTGSVNNAQPIGPQLQPFLTWAREAVDPRMNGLLLTWYDLSAGHYIGKHRDKTGDLVVGAPIVTIALGQARPFRIRPWKGQGFIDVEMPAGSALVLPWAVNQHFTHEIPKSRAATGRRISITARVFRDDA
jgi:alkylated DNA repair dioxygenase AlkB